MKQLEDNVLKIKVEGDANSIPVESFIEILGKTIAILKDLDANIAESENSNLDWSIVAASLNSPLSLSVKSTSTIGIDNGNEVIQAYLSGIRTIANGETKTLPKFFTKKTLVQTQSLNSAFQGINKIYFSTSNVEPIPTTKNTFENAKIIVEAIEKEEREEFAVELTLPITKRIKEKATLVGRLEVLSVHGASPHFVMYDALTQKKIDCFFDVKDFADIQHKMSLKPPRMQVTGTARYDRNGYPTIIKVDHYKEMRSQKELPSFKDFAGINLTDGVDATEYIRRLRSE
jgi:hypothetical protein